MFKFLFKILSPKKKPKKRSVSKKHERTIVSLLSRGNTHLQDGRYLTSQDIEFMRKNAFR